MDELDKRILALLVEDGRRTYDDIGRQVNLSAPSVKRRVDRLRASGALEGFGASSLGAGIRVEVPGPGLGILNRVVGFPRLGGGAKAAARSSGVRHLSQTTLSSIRKAFPLSKSAPPTRREHRKQ
jgi:hypothetical protein